jgi:hypothetical protein
VTDQHDPDDVDGPITPEVVKGRGAAARKRRGGEPTDGDAADLGDLSGAGDARGPDDAAPAGTGRPGTMVRIGCMVLVALGLMQVFLGGQWALDPDAARCTSARLAIDTANDDDEDFNDVTVPDDVDEVEDLDCDQAIELAGAIPDEEDEEADGEFTGASTFLTQGIGIAVIGLAQAVSGLLVLRTRKRLFRNIALGAAAAGILLPVLGIVSLLALAFAVFGLAFSRDAKAIWGGGSFLRPRPRPEPG